MIANKKTKGTKKTKAFGNTIHVNLPVDIDEYVRGLAEEQRRSVRNMLIVVIEDALKEWNKK